MLEEKAEAAGVSQNELLRRLLKDADVQAAAKEEASRDLRRKLSRIGSGLDRVARKMSEGEEPSRLLEEVIKKLQEKIKKIG